MHLRTAAFLYVLSASRAAKTCLPGTGETSDWGPDCSGAGTSDEGETVTLSEICFATYSGSSDVSTTGCLPKKYFDSLINEGHDLTKSGCTFGACWCVEDNCNSEVWAKDFKAGWAPTPMCYGGIAGANEGPTCSKNAAFKGNEYEPPNCHGRTISSKCVENNPSVGMGDGCPENAEKGACEAYRAGERDLDDSFDGTSKHCRWAPELNESQKIAACETDGECKFYANHDEGGRCEASVVSKAKSAAWKEKRGMHCADRLTFGCRENNEWMGENEKCTSQTEESACHSVNTDCSEGVCSGNATDGGAACSSHGSEHECDSAGGCTFVKQCCQWIPEPADIANTCATKGAGTLNVCSYNDGDGAPSKEIAQAGFEHGLFRLGPVYEEAHGCAIIATFRVGFGSATAFGANDVGLLKKNCESRDSWESLAEHIGHNTETIKEYCENFLPGAMKTLEQHSPGAIIAGAKAGKWDELFPGLKDDLFIVTKKPEFGECLFTAEMGKFGAAICVCDAAECNGQKSLELIVDPDRGPMRLLQFLDGSFSHLKDGVNGIVPGLMDADGNINPAKVGEVTEADVDAIMLLDGVGEKTNKIELWNIIQDYQQLNRFVEIGGDPDDPPVLPGGTPGGSPEEGTPSPNTTPSGSNAGDIDDGETGGATINAAASSIWAASAIAVATLLAD